jgi:phosphate/sulfate permease
MFKSILAFPIAIFVYLILMEIKKGLKRGEISCCDSSFKIQKQKNPIKFWLQILFLSIVAMFMSFVIFDIIIF